MKKEQIIEALLHKIGDAIACNEILDCSLTLTGSVDGDPVSRIRSAWQITRPTKIELLKIDEKGNNVFFRIIGLHLAYQNERYIQKVEFSAKIDDVARSIL